MKIKIKDGSQLEIESNSSVLDLAKQISEGLARNAVAGRVNGALVQLSHKLANNDNVEIITLKDKDGMDIFHHSTAHVMALAVKRLYPDTKISIGPAIEDGFYYDFDFSCPFKKEDLPKVEKEMEKIIQSKLSFERVEVSRQEAQKIFKDLDEPYKLELLEDIPQDEIITIYKLGELTDLCRGPHLEDISIIKAFKLQSATGAYWRGDEHNKMLTRIYGISFPKKSELDLFIEKQELARQRDSNKVGRELGFFTTEEIVGQGLPLFLPNGARTIQVMQRFIEDEEQKRGYMLTKTPIMAKKELYETSGHWEHYKEDMFILGDEEKDKEVFALRPMTCPFQFLCYKQGLKSYKDLPARYNETSLMCRFEDSGACHGLTRVRQFTMSDAHIMLRKDQLEQEFSNVVNLLMYYLEKFGIKDEIVYLRLSKWDPENKNNKYIDNPEMWEYAESVLRQILVDLKIPFVEAVGEAAFYGPKLDFQIKNVWGKEDTLCTAQVDFALAERWDMWYIDENGEKQRPCIIHRACSSYERLLAVCLEHFGGALPLWYSPIQVKILSLTDRNVDYAKSIADKLTQLGLRVEVDSRNEKVGYKIREAQLQKIPYMVIVGDNEQESQMVAVRHRKDGDIGTMSVDDFCKMVVDENVNKVIK